MVQTLKKTRGICIWHPPELDLQRVLGEKNGQVRINHEARWWFQVFFIFTPTWGDDPIWLIYFSKGLKPPTSFFCLSMQETCGTCISLIICRLHDVFFWTLSLCLSVSKFCFLSFKSNFVANWWQIGWIGYWVRGVWDHAASEASPNLPGLKDVYVRNSLETSTLATGFSPHFWKANHRDMLKDPWKILFVSRDDSIRACLKDSA